MASHPHRLQVLTDEYRVLAERLRQGGGPEKIERQHAAGKLTARERVELLTDQGAPWLEIGLLVAYDQYDGQAPGAGVVTGVGTVVGREVVVVANDATVKAGSWWPETIKKILRAQEIAMRQRIPIVYLVDSGGVNLPYQGGVFPGQYGAGRIFYYNSLMRRFLKIPQLAAVMGQCVAGGAYLPALSDVILMVDGTSFMGLGGPNLVKGATGQVVDGESLGGARMHTSSSAVAHYLAKDDKECLAMLREQVARLPRPDPARLAPQRVSRAPRRPAAELYALLPGDHRMSYEMREILRLLRGRRRARRVPARHRAGDDLRPRGHRRPGGGADRQRAQADQGEAGRGAALRRHRLHRERARRWPTSSRPRTASARRSCSCRTCPASWSGPRPRRRASSGRAPSSWRPWRRPRCPSSSSPSTTPRAPGTTRWPARASIPISSSRSRPGGWA